MNIHLLWNNLLSIRETTNIEYAVLSMHGKWSGWG